MELKERLIRVLNQYLELYGKEIRINSQAEDIKMTEFNFNSIEFIDLIVALEEEFDCEFDDSLLGNQSFSSFQSLAGYISGILPHEEVLPEAEGGSRE